MKIEFLKMIGANGFCDFNVGYVIPWEIISLLEEHYMRTGINQYFDFIDLSRFDPTYWDAAPPDIKFELCKKLHDLFEMKYVFTPEQVFSNTDDFEKAKEYDKRYTFSRTPNKVLKKRRTDACQITSLKSVRDVVFKRDGYKCVLCGSTDNLEVDHIIPVSKGGADCFENFQTLCKKCNIQKSDKE